MKYIDSWFKKKNSPILEDLPIEQTTVKTAEPILPGNISPPPLSSTTSSYTQSAPISITKKNTAPKLDYSSSFNEFEWRKKQKYPKTTNSTASSIDALEASRQECKDYQYRRRRILSQKFNPENSPSPKQQSSFSRGF